MPPCSLGTLVNMSSYCHSRVSRPELFLLFKLLSHVPCSSVTLLLLPSGPLRVSNPLLTIPFEDMYRVLIKYCDFSKNSQESLPPLPRQHSTAIGCTKNYQPIVTVHYSYCIESFEGRGRRGRGCSELWKKTIFPKQPVDHNWTEEKILFKENNVRIHTDIRLDGLTNLFVKVEKKFL